MKDWKDIKGYEGDYKISNDGEVFSIKSKKILKNYDRNGYHHISLCKNSVVKKYKVHRLVGMHFIKNHNNYPFINHIDGNPKNNNVDNLEWCTPKMNIMHAYKNGLMNTWKRFGEKRPAAKLKNHLVLEIRKLYKTGDYSQRKLAAMYGVSCNTIKNITLKRTWKHI